MTKEEKLLKVIMKFFSNQGIRFLERIEDQNGEPIKTLVESEVMYWRNGQENKGNSKYFYKVPIENLVNFPRICFDIDDYLDDSYYDDSDEAEFVGSESDYNEWNDICRKWDKYVTKIKLREQLLRCE